LLSFFIYQTEGLTARYFFYFYFSMCLTAITFIDLELMVIPDLLIWPTAVLGAVNAALTPYPPLAGATLWRFLREGGWNDWAISLFASIAAFILGYLSLKALSVIYKLWRGHKGLGDGDPPLLAVIAMYLGLPAIAPILLLSSMVALISVVALLSAGRFQKQGLALKAIPFGPFLSLAALIWLFFGQKFLTWYFSLLSLPQS
jgi:leader peptidase (prepilin peptidase)/N-methyltransferase